MLQIRGPKLLLYPTRNETLDSFWKKQDEISASPDQITEIQMSCLLLNNQMIERLKRLFQKVSVSRISLHSCTANPDILGPFLGELPLETLRLHGSTFQRRISLPQQCALSQSLEELSLNGSQWESDVDVLIDFLKICVSLRRVAFKCCGLSDDALCQIVAALEALPNLQHLDFAANRCGSKSMEAISALIRHSSSLEHLDLSYQVLHRDDKLRVGDLASAISEAGSHLKVLRLAGNLLDDEQAAQLAMSLTSSCSLRHLDLSTNDISSKGLSPLSDALKTNLHLTNLNIKSNAFSDLSSLSIEENYSLESLEHSCRGNRSGPANANQTITHTCCLNQGGRRLLCHEPNVALGLWSDVLARCSRTKNIDSIYYFLRNGSLLKQSR